MIDAKDSKDFEFYADLYPIIRNDGWKASEFPTYGSIHYFYQEAVTDNPCDYRYWMVGITIRPSSWSYCWRGSSGWHSCGGQLEIDLDADHNLVYQAAKDRAVEWLDSESGIKFGVD